MPPAMPAAWQEARWQAAAATLLAIALAAVATRPADAASSVAALEQRPVFWHYVIAPTSGGAMQVRASCGFGRGASALG